MMRRGLGVIGGIAVATVALPVVVAASGGEGHHDVGYAKQLLLFATINFTIFAAVLYLILRRPVREFLAHRAAEFRKQREEAAVARQRAEERLERARQRYAALADERARVAREVQEVAELEAARIQADAERFAEQVRRSAEARVAQFERQAAERVLAIVADRLTAATETRLRERFDVDTDRRWSERILERVGAA